MAGSYRSFPPKARAYTTLGDGEGIILNPGSMKVTL